MFNLNQRIILVTGAASGIGAAIADVFCKAGARVYAADRDFAGAERLSAGLRAQGHFAQPVDLDITSDSQCVRAIDQIRAETGPLDVLINNAGVGSVGKHLDTSGAELDRLYQVNVRGTFNLTKAALPDMIKRGRGNIINVASIGGVVGIRDRAAYCTTKFAVVGMTKCLALDYAANGIRANCICPGRVETPFVKARLQEYPDPAAAYREMSSTQLFGRMITPEEIAAAALYLASDEAGMITGSSFLVDCGWTAGK